MPLIVNNALGLMVDILNICEFKVTNITIGSHLSVLVFKKWVNKLYTHFLNIL
jgi:hypothetical protein